MFDLYITLLFTWTIVMGFCLDTETNQSTAPDQLITHFYTHSAPLVTFIS